ncbi:MAG: disulfide oxidoreductase [Desulfobacteraceae bacterium 4572_35.2]|nr:MAG: disulfide oxidoreductase [Desulfobacteraceae bacterium 4572_35.2]
MIEKSTKMTEVLQMHPNAVHVLAEFGLRCSTCSGARHESVQQGAINHGLDVNELLEKLNALLLDNKKITS